MTTQILWDTAKAVLRGKFIAIQPQETRKASNRQLNFTPETAGKEDQKSQKLSSGKKS